LPTTVTSPATAKNAISVGATLSWRNAYTRRLAAPVADVRVEIMNAPDAPDSGDTLVLNMRVVGVDWGPQLETLHGQRLLLAPASDGGAACTPGSADAARGGVLVALRAAGCSLATKMQTAAAAGAVALLLATRQAETGYMIVPREGAPDLLPVGSIPLSLAQQLRQYADQGGGAGVTAIYVTFAPHVVCSCPSYEDIASYSSFGPTLDRRIKPDIVAPGDITSAYSDGKADGLMDQCRTQRKQGTSMATPVVAGSAALARQYFMAGFYPSGARDPAAAYTPSGVLLKAVLLGGASDMIGYTEASFWAGCGQLAGWLGSRRAAEVCTRRAGKGRHWMGPNRNQAAGSTDAPGSFDADALPSDEPAPGAGAQLPPGLWPRQPDAHPAHPEPGAAHLAHAGAPPPLSAVHAGLAAAPAARSVRRSGPRAKGRVFAGPSAHPSQDCSAAPQAAAYLAPPPLQPHPRQVIDLAAISEGETHKYCITVTGPVTVTLAWYDWPASPAAQVTLQNDLDLVVLPGAAHGLKLRGNSWHDNLNTVRGAACSLLPWRGSCCLHVPCSGRALQRSHLSPLPCLALPCLAPPNDSTPLPRCCRAPPRPLPKGGARRPCA
jgi:hypothetical protein